MRAIIIFILWLILGFFYWSQKTSCCGAVSSDTEIIPTKATETLDADTVLTNNTLIDTSSVTSLNDGVQGEVDGDQTEDSSVSNEIDSASNEQEDEPDNNDSQTGTSKSYEGKSIKKEKGRTLIYFDYNDGSRIKNPEISKYLSQVSWSLKNNLNKVVLNGHTDDEGSESANYALGLRRAQQVKELLVRKGVSPQRILTYSKGEKRPIASNDTEEGKQQNRRVELIVIK